MGDEQLSYLGFSYGTAIGQVYADLFPERVRSMVLDGVLELGPSGLELADEQAAGFETALAALRRVLRRRRGLRDRRATRSGAVEQVLALAEQPGGIPAPSADRPAGPGEANLGISSPSTRSRSGASSTPRWPLRSGGDGSELVDLADEYIGIGDFEIYFAVNCMDFAWPTGDPRRLPRCRQGDGRAGPRTSARRSSTTTSAASTGRSHPRPARAGHRARHPADPRHLDHRRPGHPLRGWRHRGRAASRAASSSPTRVTATRSSPTASPASTTSSRRTWSTTSCRRTAPSADVTACDLSRRCPRRPGARA